MVSSRELIARIDPAENRVVERIPVANRPKGLALSDDQVWFAVQPSGAGHRGGRLVVGGSGLISGPDRSVLHDLVRDGDLVAQLGLRRSRRPRAARRERWHAGRAEPRESRCRWSRPAGPRYAFQLRRGIRYSDGTLVKASDFRRAFERPLRAGIPQVCRGTPRRSRRLREAAAELAISAGASETDDATGTIVFHLRRPEREFLSAPESSCFRSRAARLTGRCGTRPVASTGPYMIESYVPGRALTLVRNPYFRVWSRAARPDGFPDEIEFRLAARAQGVTAVERGRADVRIPLSTTPRTSRRLRSLRARYPSQVHVHAGAGDGLPLPQYDTSSVRRRAGAAGASTTPSTVAPFQRRTAPGFAEPTCQPRPPGTVGFRRYCPYTAAPGRTGEWKAPDLARVRAASSPPRARGA